MTSSWLHLLKGWSLHQSRGGSDRATSRAQIRVGARYLLQTDISQFYPSIYTHTIPWVIHTKTIAKKNTKNKTLLGNRLDSEIQCAQHGQTKGIPIGPDTSLGIAELLLSEVDFQLQSKCNIHGGVRFIDDIELTFQRISDAEDTLSVLEGLLHEYELQINSSKTRILELPEAIESAYVTELRRYLPQLSKATRSEFIDFFNKSFILSRDNPGTTVLRYAIPCLSDIVVKHELWSFFQILLWQCVAIDPGCLRFVIDILWINIHRDIALSIDPELAQNALESLILRSASVGHSSEVLWSLWAALLFGLRLSDKSADAIAYIDDSFVATAGLFASGKKVFSSPLDSKLWASWLEEGCFKEDHWLFVYEAYQQNWLSAEVSSAKLSTDANCRFLKDQGVSFIDDTAALRYHAKRGWRYLKNKAKVSSTTDYSGGSY